MKRYLILSLAVFAMSLNSTAQQGYYNSPANTGTEVYVAGNDGTGNRYSGGYSKTAINRHVHTSSCRNSCDIDQSRVISRSCSRRGYYNQVVQQRVWIPGQYIHKNGCRTFQPGYWTWIDKDVTPVHRGRRVGKHAGYGKARGRYHKNHRNR